MNFDFDIPQIPQNVKLCKRGKLDTGTFCNYNCVFCYYKNDLQNKIQYNIILDRIKKLESLGCRDFDLSGGEPSILPEFFDILKYLNNKGCTVSCVTNGFNFAKYEFTQKAQEFGLNEILFSLHSGDPQTHDFITGVKNSYKRITQAIRNANQLGIKVRINSTLIEQNADLKGFAETLQNFDISQINFLPVNNFAQTQHQKTPDLGALSKFADAAKCETNIRYIPFCWIPEHRNKIKNYYQHIFDTKDWNIAWYEYLPDTYGNLNRIIKENRKIYYFKKMECLKCPHNLICDGFKI